jgi:hypothetical protein
MKIGIHGLFKRCVLLRNCKLGKSLMPNWNYQSSSLGIWKYFHFILHEGCAYQRCKIC